MSVARGKRWASAALALSLAMALWGLRPATVRAIPPLPSVFWGTVQIDGAEAPEGTRVAVWSGGREWAATGMVWNADSAQVLYQVDVPGDDPETVAVEGPQEGTALEFRVSNGQVTGSAQQSGTWHAGSVNRLDLSVELPRLYCLPLVLRAGNGF